MQGAYQIIHALEKEGYEAYMVGGAVRDLLLSKTPKDIDIVTKAHPDDVIAIAQKNDFACTNLVGKAFGVIVITTEFGQYEVATFRKETYGSDSHRPETIIYADTLKEDVSRRDFTVNGLAMDSYGNIVDYVGGQKDLKKKILRTIGEPKERFTEDALRLFRACRFCAQLGFDIDFKTQEAMPEAFHRVDGLSLERVKIELEKLLLAKFPAKGLDLMVRSGLAERKCQKNENGNITKLDILPELSHLVDLEQEEQYHKYDAWMHTLVAVQNSQADLTIRWGALLHDIAKGLPEIRAIINDKITDRGHDELGATMAKEILLRLGYSEKFANRVAWIVKNHMRYHFFAANEEANFMKWLRQEARSKNYRSNEELRLAFKELNEVCLADIIACGKDNSSLEGTKAFGEYVDDICKKMPLHTKELNYNQELIKICGPNVRYILPELLTRVQDNVLENEENALMDAALRWLKRHANKEQ